jgi:uncharacterized membrane protein YeaQ/YmgE (transglycosylase-associated protein family)
MKASVQAALRFWLLVGLNEVANGQSAFTEVDLGLEGAFGGSFAWGDYDHDGKLDLAVNGSGLPRLARIYRNNGDGTFSDIAAGLQGVTVGGAAWGDLDNDSDLDLAIVGIPGVPSGDRVAFVYRNDGDGIFANVESDLVGAGNGGLALGDYDNDGRIDLLLAGDRVWADPVTLLYRNLGNGRFTNSGAVFPGVRYSSLAWGDYNNDGRLDVLLSGLTTNLGPNVSFCRIYRNDANASFTDIQAGFPHMDVGAVAWGDYNNDGWIDALLTGLFDLGDQSRIYARVYRNNGNGTFTDIAARLPGVWRSAVAWGDFDNDGRLDIALTGMTNLNDNSVISRIYRNNGDGTFADIGAGLPGVGYGSAGAVAWGDTDNDGDLDLLLTGETASGQWISRLYRNESTVKNTPPTAPGGLSASVSGQQVTLHWQAATDAQTPPLGLTYNIRVGTRPGGGDIVSPQSASNGVRRLPAMGNAQHRLFSDLVGLKGGLYYWSVQAVDTAFAGGPFAPEQTLVVPPAIRAIELQTNGVVLLRFLGLPGSSYTVEASTNLTGWAAIATLSAAANGAFEYAETNVATIPARFYRVRSP